MTFGESIRHVFRHLTSLQGRARRAEFWWFYLFLQLVSIPVGIIVAVLLVAALAPALASIDSTTGEISDSAVADVAGPVLAVYGFALLLGLASFGLSLAVWVRRLHDVGQTGHWLWLNLVGLGIVPLIMAIMDGEAGPNRYGPDPKAAERMPVAGWPQQPGYPPVPPVQ
ncbi:DUF805 domain-containing protein [Demequina sp. SYSU T00039]|uniref:DUF805 domain-containing protein n=1 Tax=Demequina lignilytica TaxID=3051663 RepID=A0AAW7M0J3_9MICO|nr:MULTISPECIES: DUF805 domain-containing protein [unclassified Demequina]MDN4477835.1 DUF805 domain-containing protein [Demequina sp. SYSU T00039-1]MDN4487744.1 DUF805 domain-containing protein [Demequina sp. SYSU T00039]